jgi:hypothetical protein
VNTFATDWQYNRDRRLFLWEAKIATCKNLGFSSSSHQRENGSLQMNSTQDKCHVPCPYQGCNVQMEEIK